MRILCFLPETFNFQNKLGMLTRSAGVNFQPCANEAEVYMFAEKEVDKQFFLFLSSESTKLLFEFSMKFPESKIVVILQNSTLSHMSSFIDRNNIESFVSTNGGEFDVIELISLLKKFKAKKVIGLEKHLNFPAIYNEKIIKNSNDKRESLTLLEGFISKIGGDSLKIQHYAQRICELADELLISSILENNNKERTNESLQTFKFNDKDAIKIKWGYDGEIFGLSIKDPYGKTEKKSILQFLETKQKSDLNKLNLKLGVKLIYDRLHHYVVNVKENEYSEIVCLLHIDKKYKDFEKRLRSFHYFQIEGD